MNFRQVLIVFGLLLIGTQATAQNLKTFQIQFEKEGDHTVWIGSDADAKDGKIAEEIAADGKSIELAAPDEINGKSAFVHNASTNKVAKKSLLEILKTKSWKPQAKDFTLTYVLKVTIGNAKGKVNNGAITLTAGDQTRTELLDDSANGTVEFFLLSSSKANITYTGKSTKGESLSLSESADLTTNEVQTITLIAPEDASVITPKANSPATSTSESKNSEPTAAPEKPSSPLQTIFNMLIALAMIGGIGYGIWWYINNNQGQVEELATKAGLNPSTPATPDLPDLQPAAPEPLKQILLDPSASDPVAPIMGSIPSGTPKITLPNGSTLDVPEGESTIGRENATFTMQNESSVSRTHAKLVKTGTTVTLQDLNSTNGTYVNGQKVEQIVTLQSGDIIQVGSVQIQFEA